MTVVRELECGECGETIEETEEMRERAEWSNTFHWPCCGRWTHVG